MMFDKHQRSGNWVKHKYSGAYVNFTHTPTVAPKNIAYSRCCDDVSRQTPPPSAEHKYERQHKRLFSPKNIFSLEFTHYFCSWHRECVREASIITNGREEPFYAIMHAHHAVGTNPKGAFE